MLCVFSLFILFCSCAIVPHADHELKIVSYNVRGSFGDVDAYKKKAVTIAFALQTHELDDSDIILFQEIDSSAVVEQLISEELVLSNFRYAVVAPMSEHSITQAIISRYPLRNVRFHAISHADVGATRGFLEATAVINDRELVLYNLHLKSKRDGERETEPQRRAVIDALARRMRMQMMHNPLREIIIGGDMNSEIVAVDESSGFLYALPAYNEGERSHALRIASLTQVPSLQDAGDSMVFVSPWGAASWPGSYYFRDEWQQIDHFFLSPTLFDQQGFEYQHFEVAVDETDPLPDSKFSAGSAESDHLPIVLTITLP